MERYESERASEPSVYGIALAFATCMSLNGWHGDDTYRALLYDWRLFFPCTYTTCRSEGVFSLCYTYGPKLQDGWLQSSLWRRKSPTPPSPNQELALCFSQKHKDCWVSRSFVFMPCGVLYRVHNYHTQRRVALLCPTPTPRVMEVT